MTAPHANFSEPGKKPTKLFQASEKNAQKVPSLGKIQQVFSKPWNADQKQRIFFLNLFFVCFIWLPTGAAMVDFWDSLDGLPWDAGACWDVAALRQ
ncbi:MAG: hypothetical protein NTY53_16490, partial [Kiritimatiellaeota bacterium]|nr:hypothetical protein [Kiritimatiellota bacterium]